MERKESIF